MSLLDLLLNEPSAAERMMGIMSATGASGPQAPFGSTRPSPYSGPGNVNLGGPPHQQALDIAQWIEGRPGFEVSGLHGWEGQGPISSGHIEGSQHYGPGFAGDVSYVGGGRFPNETAALNWLVDRASQRYGDTLTENLWQVPDHYDHWHFGTRPGG